ncbi:MAG: hypothetical protein IPM50_10835 [Acidobacteriota bacterium]|nr:MAG: hypothetical protein IPM50_10835 [Acidobacteriota bacterium]
MTKSLSAAAALLVLWPICVLAQSVDSRVENIRQRYNGIAEKVRLAETDDEAAATGEIVVNELSINSRNRQWRAVGIYNRNVKFFYTGGDTEESLYPDRLVFVKITGNVSARTVYDELLFSDSGVLLFHFRRADGDGPQPDETRIYFAKGKALRLNINGKIRERLTAADAKTVADSLALSRFLKAIFSSSLRL